MKDLSKFLVLAIVVLFASFSVQAQSYRDSTTSRDTSKSRDTSRFRRSQVLAALFADTAKLTSSDYQLHIEKTFLLLTHVANKSDLGIEVNALRKRLADSDSLLAVLKDNVINNSGALNLRN